MNNNSKRNTENDKRKRWYIGIVLVLIVVIIASITGYQHWSKKKREKQAQETGELFIAALENQNYAQLSELLSISSLEDIDYTKEEVQARYETIYGGVGVNNIETNNVEITKNEEGDLFTLQYELHMETSLGELEPQFYKTTLSETDEGFTIDWNTSLIFPKMELGDTIQIQFVSGKRGDILDRNGHLLAGEGTVWQAGLYPALLGDGEEKEENLKLIAGTFDIEAEQLKNLLSAEWVEDESFVPFTYVDEEKTPEVKGVVYQESTTRVYPLGESAAHLIGYTGEASAEDIEENPSLQSHDIIGKSGLEATFEERLRGSRGGKINILSDAGELKSTLQEAPIEDGEDVTLTIDAELQQRYFDGFKEKSGGAVVMEPKSGELLVLTSSPSYDPALMARGISDEDYQTYIDNPESPFLARYSARYAPASTFKIITAAIGLDSGVTNLEETRTITGLEWQKDESWGNYAVTRVSEQPTKVDLEDALVYSDNIFFAQEALEIGAEKFMDGLTKFPFNESFDLPLNMEPAQITNSGVFDSEALLVDTAFGQGQLLMSPLHQIVFYSPFANDGQLIFPKLELDTETPEPIEPITQITAETIKELLIQVVENSNGTAHVLNNAPLILGAKTGTAEFQGNKSEDNNDINGFLYAFDAETSSFSSIIFLEDESGSNVAEQFAPLISQHE